MPLENILIDNEAWLPSQNLFLSLQINIFVYKATHPIFKNNFHQFAWLYWSVIAQISFGIKVNLS